MFFLATSLFDGSGYSIKTEGPSSSLFPFCNCSFCYSYFWERKDRGMIPSRPKNKGIIFTSTFV